jgi:hypothetical protein
MEKTDLFDRIATAFGFRTTDTGRNPRFRYEELTRVYDRLNDLGEVVVSRDGTENQCDLRSAIADSLGVDDGGGRPITKPGLRQLAAIMCDEDVATQGGSLAQRRDLLPDAGVEAYPSPEDLDLAADLNLVREWDDPETCICVSRQENSTRYHSLWTVRDGEVVPACRAYNPSMSATYRLAPERSIARTREECHYCDAGATRP